MLLVMMLVTKLLTMLVTMQLSYDLADCKTLCTNIINGQETVDFTSLAGGILTSSATWTHSIRAAKPGSCRRKLESKRTMRRSEIRNLRSAKMTSASCRVHTT